MSIKTGNGNGQARICLVTWRNFSRSACRCGHYEAEDVLTEVDDVDLLRLDATPSLALKRRWLGGLLWRGVSKRLASINPGLRPVQLSRPYDLLVVMCQDVWDLPLINAVKGWEKYCRASVCWLDEVWGWLVPQLKSVLHVLNRFDYVALGLGGSLDSVRRVIDRPCHHVPGAVDAIRFSPYPEPPPRVIDACSIGRKWEGVHRSLLDLSAKKGFFYFHDTAVDGGIIQVLDHRQHRNVLANTFKRSRSFVVAPAKMDLPKETHGQSEIGYRFFEGSAAGTVMIGRAPVSEDFPKLFGWPDSVIDIKTDGSDVGEVLSRLIAQPERLRQISRRNAREALLRHDWMYRWKQILGIAGLKPTAAMEAREQRLKQLAELAANDS